MKFLLSLSLLLLTGCASAPSNDRWDGHWQGPEGTYLNIHKNDGSTYDLTIQSLDSKEIYSGVLLGDHIEFMRRGQIETIRRGSGQDTRMKWLLSKSNCLVINPGEGFCR